MPDLDMFAASRTNSKSKSVSAEAELKPFDEVTDCPPPVGAMLEGHHFQYNTGSRAGPGSIVGTRSAAVIIL